MEGAGWEKGRDGLARPLEREKHVYIRGVRCNGLGMERERKGRLAIKKIRGEKGRRGKKWEGSSSGREECKEEWDRGGDR
jgi:hypothetical protein